MIKLRRKIQKISGSYYLNLPKEWITHRKIDETKELEIVILEDGSLKIAPEIEFNFQTGDETVILPPEKYVARQIIRKCLMGAKRIIIQSKNPISTEIRDEIYRFVKKLPSAEIIDEGTYKIEIQDLGYTTIPAKPAINRIYQLTNGIFSYLLEGNYDKMEEYINGINRFYIIVVIHIRRFLTHDIYSGSKDTQDFTPIEALDSRMLVGHIHRISTILKLNSDLLNGALLDQKIRTFGETVKKMFEDAMDSYFKNDSEKACVTWEYYYKLIENSTLLLNNLKEENDRLILYNFLRIADYCRRISDLVP